MAATVEQPGVLAAHIPCAGCGYDLYGCAADGVCPECGATVAEARDRRRLVYAPRGILRAIAWLTGITATLRALGIVFGIFLIIAAAHMDPRKIDSLSTLGTPLSAVTMLMQVATLGATAALVRRRGPQRNRRYANTVRIALYLSIAVGVPLAVLHVLNTLATFDLLGRLEYLIYWPPSVLVRIAGKVILVGLVALLPYTLWLDSTRVERQVFAWAGGLCASSLFAAELIGNLVRFGDEQPWFGRLIYATSITSLATSFWVVRRVLRAQQRMKLARG